jgi:hypothetical protein
VPKSQLPSEHAARSLQRSAETHVTRVEVATGTSQEIKNEPQTDQYLSGRALGTAEAIRGTYPAVIDAETQDGPTRLVMDPAAAAVLAEELTQYVKKFSGS